MTVENHRADEGGGVIAVALKEFGPCWMGRRQGNGEVCDALRTRQESSQDGGMRSICYGAGGKRLRKTNSVFCQAVEGRSLNVLVAVTMHVVGTKRVDGDQKYIRL